MNTTDNGVLNTQTKFDPQGVDIGLEDPFPPPGEGAGECIEYDPNYVAPVPFAASLIPDGTSAKCIVDGIEQSCQLISSETTTKCPDNDCGPRLRVDPDTGKTYLAFINAFADGYVGFMPIGSIYLGHGQYESPGRYPDPESTPLEFNHGRSLPQEPGSTPPKPKEGDKAKFDLDRFKYCVGIMYHVTQAASDGRSQSFSTTRTQGRFDGITEKGVSFTVNTSMTAYTSSELRGLKTNPEPGTILGGTIPGHPYLNFVASDVARNPRTSLDVITMIQVHELGNALGEISGYTPDARNPNLRRYDSDSGNALVECVYGGFVKPDGRITFYPGE